MSSPADRWAAYSAVQSRLFNVKKCSRDGADMRNVSDPPRWEQHKSYSEKYTMQSETIPYHLCCSHFGYYLIDNSEQIQWANHNSELTHVDEVTTYAVKMVQHNCKIQNYVCMHLKESQQLAARSRLHICRKMATKHEMRHYFLCQSLDVYPLQTKNKQIFSSSKFKKSFNYLITYPKSQW